MTDRPPAGASDPTYVTYTSAAYAAESATDVEESTAAWLETQAEMPLIREVSRRTFELMDLRAGQCVEAAIEQLVRTNDAGTYSGIAVMFVAAGKVPSP